MSVKDTASKVFFRQKEVVAELCNDFVFHGEIHVEAEKLQLIETGYYDVTKDEDGEFESDNRYRDLLYNCVAYADEHTGYFLLGIEAQSYIDYGMVLRVLEYNVREYLQQYREKEKSRLLKPVITVVVNLSGERWTAPRRLSEMLELVSDKLKKYILNFEILVIEPEDIEDKIFDNGYTNLKFVLHCCKNAKNQKKLRELFKPETPYTFTQQTITLVNVIFNANMPENQGMDFKEEENDQMICTWKTLLDAEHAEGKAEGLAAGKAEGLAEGIVKQQVDTVLKSLKAKIPLDIIGEITNLSKDEVQNIMIQYQIRA